MGLNLHVLGGRFCARSPGIRTLPVKLRGLGDIKFGLSASANHLNPRVRPSHPRAPSCVVKLLERDDGLGAF